MSGFASASCVRLVIGTAEVLDVFVLRVGMKPQLTAAIGTIDKVAEHMYFDASIEKKIEQLK